MSQADEVWHAGDIGDLSVTDSLMKTKPMGGLWNIDDAKRVYSRCTIVSCEG
jgi:hypothetical protein